jgi:GTPase SAR1 family protein
MRLQLWDATGAERHRTVISALGCADGCIVTYDVSHQQSYDHVVEYMREIHTRAPPYCAVMLCGNKCDVDRVVTYEEGKYMADSYGVPFWETSALTGHNVEDMFMTLASCIKHDRYDPFHEQFTQAGAANAHNDPTGGSDPSIVRLTAPDDSKGFKSGCW